MSAPTHRFRFPVLLFFLISGAVGLILEVVWTRIFGTYFGNTVLAASAVVTAYMLGFALGSSVLGRWADRHSRPLLLYGCLEVGVGLWVLMFPWLNAAASTGYVWFYRAYQPGEIMINAVRLVISLLLLLPPTFLMGGTLPVLGRYLGLWHKEPGREVGFLYGINTLGGVFGCFLCGFVLLVWLGVQETMLCAGGAALSIGILAVGLGIYGGQPVAEKSAKAHSKPKHAEMMEATIGTEYYVLMGTCAITGFCALAYEVIWTRVLIFLLNTSIYSFATMLTIFLVGIALGSFISARFFVPRMHRPWLWYGVLELLIGVTALLSLPLIAYLHRVDLIAFPYFAWAGRWQTVWTTFVDAAVVMLVPTLFMGAVFPIVATCCVKGSARLGRRVGQVYAANTLGCMLGSLLAGFLLIPWLGTHRSLLTLAALNLAVGVVILFFISRDTWNRLALGGAGCVVATVAFLLTPPDVFHGIINTYHNPSKIIFLKENPAGTVTVHEMANQERLIAVDGVDVAGLDFMLRTTQKLQGYIPLCLHPNPQRVVQIGFGSGETAWLGKEFGVKDYTVVEICPAVFEAGKCYEDINHGSYRDPRIRKLIMDGKNFAFLSNEKFDIVMNDSVFPGSFGDAALYTVDHFRNCRERLAEGGLFSCWVPVDLRASEMQMIMRSFQEVFPHASFWVASNCMNKHGLLLGSLTPLQIDFKRVKAVLERPQVKADLAAIAIENIYDFLDCHVCDENALRKLVEASPINTDAHPLLEFSCAIRLPVDQRLKQIYNMIALNPGPVAPYVVNFEDEAQDRDELNQRYEANIHIFRANVAELASKPKLRQSEMEQAAKAHPGDAHVKSREDEWVRDLRDFKQALATNPNNVRIAMRLANLQFVGGRHQEAAALYRQLFSNPADMTPRAYLNYAEALFQLGQAAEAETLLKECLSRWPNVALAHDQIAGVYLMTARVAEAETHMEEALRLEPDNPMFQQHQNAVRVSRAASASQ